MRMRTAYIHLRIIGKGKGTIEKETEKRGHGDGEIEKEPEKRGRGDGEKR